MQSNAYPPFRSPIGCNSHTQNYRSKPRYKNGMANVAGFTLVELSIVLVIIGLIIGGVLVGRDLINAAKLRSVLTDIEQFNAAAQTFRTKYNCLPGDCKNATDYFGQFPICGVYSENPTLNANTCNGDGNGLLLYQGENAPVWANYWQFDETSLFWQHLSSAKLIQGNYSGTLYWGTPLRIGVNVPPSSLERGCYAINSSFQNGESDRFPYSSMKGNFFTLGNPYNYNGTGTGTGTCNGGLYSLTATSAKNIDSKIDDGKPFTGNVQTPAGVYGGYFNYSGNTTPGCTNLGGGAIYSTAIYHTSAATTACQLFFKAAF